MSRKIRGCSKESADRIVDLLLADPNAMDLFHKLMQGKYPTKLTPPKVPINWPDWDVFLELIRKKGIYVTASELGVSEAHLRNKLREHGLKYVHRKGDKIVECEDQKGLGNSGGDQQPPTN